MHRLESILPFNLIHLKEEITKLRAERITTGSGRKNDSIPSCRHGDALLHFLGITWDLGSPYSRGLRRTKSFLNWNLIFQREAV